MTLVDTRHWSWRLFCTTAAELWCGKIRCIKQVQHRLTANVIQIICAFRRWKKVFICVTRKILLFSYFNFTTVFKRIISCLLMLYCRLKNLFKQFTFYTAMSSFIGQFLIQLTVKCLFVYRHEKKNFVYWFVF